MTTLDELEQRLAVATTAGLLPLSVALDQSGSWAVILDPMRSGLVRVVNGTPCFDPEEAALIVAAINALPGLIESAKRVEELRAALAVMSEAADQFGDWDDDDKKLFVALRLKDLRRARAVLAKDATPSPGAITGTRKAEAPCSDCIDGWCQMNCGPRVG
jgi:hypothetical protein